jgi:hypothetical protein
MFYPRFVCAKGGYGRKLHSSLQVNLHVTRSAQDHGDEVSAANRDRRFRPWTPGRQGAAGYVRRGVDSAVGSWLAAVTRAARNAARSFAFPGSSGYRP